MAVDRELTASRAALTALALTDSLRLGDLKAFEQQLRSPGQLRESWSQLAVMDSSGRLLFEVGTREAPQRSLSETSEIATLARARSGQLPKGVLLSVPVTESAGEAQHRTWVGVTATTAHGERYLLTSRISPAVWQSLLEGSASDGDGDADVTLFDDQQRVIARSVASRLPANRLPPTSSVAGSAVRSSDLPTTQQIDSGKRYAGWQLLTDGGWKVGESVPAAGFDAEQRSTVLWGFWRHRGLPAARRGIFVVGHALRRGQVAAARGQRRRHRRHTDRRCRACAVARGRRRFGEPPGWADRS